MTEIIKGVNTAVMVHSGKLIALAMRIRNAQGQEELYYMQHMVIRDFMMILSNKLRKVVEKISLEGEAYKAHHLAENQSLVQHLPTMRQEDVESPDANRKIMSIALKQDAETFTIIAALQDGNVSLIRFSNSQVEFLIHAMTQAMQTSGDKEAIAHLCGALDFITLYDTEFNDIAKLDYKQYPHEAWCLNLFPNYVAMLFSYQTEEGEKIQRGAVIKSYVKADSADMQSIATRIAALVPSFGAAAGKNQLKQVFCKDIPAELNQSLNVEQCLTPLHQFYLEKSGK